MAVLNPEADALFERAVADASMQMDGFTLVVVDSEHNPKIGRPVMYIPAGVPVNGDEVPGMNSTQTQALRTSRRPHRIVVQGRAEDPALLGLLRWAVDGARQNQTAPSVWEFAWTVLDAGVSAAHAERPASGVLHNVLPQVRDANRAASRLVTEYSGPQVGSYFGPWGTLFRTHPDFGGDATLAQRTVTMAALYAPWIHDRTGSDSATAKFVADVDPNASHWWTVLTQDPVINSATGVIELLEPTDEELDNAADAAPQEWRPLAHLIDRVLKYGAVALSPGGWTPSP
jgi:hypothetical protein